MEMAREVELTVGKGKTKGGGRLGARVCIFNESRDGFDH